MGGIYIHVIYMHTYIYIYIYIEREREREREREKTRFAKVNFHILEMVKQWYEKKFFIVRTHNDLYIKSLTAFEF